MYGSGVGTLRLDAFPPTSQYGSPITTLFIVTGNQGNVWKKGEVYISPNTDYQLRFTSVRGTSSDGIIAIDDISRTECRKDKGSLNTGQIVGLVIGVIVVIIAGGLVLTKFLCFSQARVPVTYTAEEDTVGGIQEEALLDTDGTTPIEPGL